MAFRHLSAADIRIIVRENAPILAAMLDQSPCGYDLSFDDGVAAAARLLVEHVPVFHAIMRHGAGLSQHEVERMSWNEVVFAACGIIVATQEAWRDAWPNGFLQSIFYDELRPYSAFVQAQVRR